MTMNLLLIDPRGKKHDFQRTRRIIGGQAIAAPWATASILIGKACPPWLLRRALPAEVT